MIAGCEEEEDEYSAAARLGVYQDSSKSIESSKAILAC